MELIDYEQYVVKLEQGLMPVTMSGAGLTLTDAAFLLATELRVQHWSETEQLLVEQLTARLCRLRFPEVSDEPRHPLSVTCGEIAAWMQRHQVAHMTHHVIPPFHAPDRHLFLTCRGEETTCILWGRTEEEVLTTLGELVLHDIGPSRAHTARATFTRTMKNVEARL